MSLESITLAVLLSAVSCAVAAQDIFAKKGLFSLFEPSLAMLHPIDGKNTLGEYPVLNVGTDLRLVVSSVSYSTPHNTPLGRAVMFSQRDKKHLLVMQMSANLIQSPGSDWTDEPCKREDLLWKRSTGKNMTDVNCVAINHLVSYFASPTGEFQQVFNLAKSEGLEFPPTALQYL